MRVRGFTLIELLVVIAIIGILAAILLPARRHEPEKDVEVVFGVDEGHGFPVDSDYQRPFGS